MTITLSPLGLYEGWWVPRPFELVHDTSPRRHLMSFNLAQGYREHVASAGSTYAEVRPRRLEDGRKRK